jgi:hypothetical protein
MMKNFVALLMIGLTLQNAFAARTEFYCTGSLVAGASQLNSGTSEGSPLVNSVNGAYNATTHVFTASDAPDLSGVVDGQDFASIYVASGATVATFISLITAHDNTAKTVTVSATAKSGTETSTAGSGINCRIRGSWVGPNGTDNFPFVFADPAMRVTTNVARINFKSASGRSFQPAYHTSIGGGDTTHQYDDYLNADYTTTAVMSRTLGGPIEFEGYTTTAGDGGLCHWVAHTNVTAFYAPWNLITGTGNKFKNIWFSGGGHGASSDHQNMFTIGTGGGNTFYRCYFSGAWEDGLAVSSAGSQVLYCGFYGNNVNTANARGAIQLSVSSLVKGCVILHCPDDRSGVADGSGIWIDASSGSVVTVQDTFIGDVWGSGIAISGNSFNVVISNVGVWRAAAGAFDFGSSSAMTSASSCALINCYMAECGFGLRGYSGGQALSHTYAYNLGYFQITNAVTSLNNASFANTIQATVNPFVDSINGDFRLNATASGGAVWRQAGLAPQMWPVGLNPTVATSIIPKTTSAGSNASYPDLGPLDHIDPAGGSSPSSYGFVR